MHEIETASGTVRGPREGGVSCFLGIPYADPPVGSRRFTAPVPATPWRGVRDCVEFGAIPVQPASGPAAPIIGANGLRQSEDCLSLNVWTPEADGARRPVVVWLYGGGFMAGCSAAPWSNGARLAANDVVVVAPNYRLGVFGFWHLAPALGETFADATNAGLLDAVRALEWVQENIAAFGGDPDRVTIAGESAGGGAVALLMAMPRARGLFHRAIIESAGLHIVHEPEDEAVRVANLVLDELGLARSAPAELFALPTEALMDAQMRMAVAWMTAERAAPLAPAMRMAIEPVADGRVVPTPMWDAFANGAPDVPLLIGTNADELRLTGSTSYEADIDEAGVVARASSIFGGPDEGAHAADVYRASLPDGATPFDVMVEIDSDRCVRIPALRVAERHAGPTYVYRWNLAGSGMGTVMGSAHGLEVPFVFDNLDAPGVVDMLGPVTDDGRKLAARMCGTWAAFARDGAPSFEGVDEWPTYRIEDRRVMELAVSPSVLDDPGGAQRRLWDGVQ